MSTESKKRKRTSRTTKSNGGGTRTRSVSDGMGASLFEVSSEDVESLKDDELRELVARLCKATLIEAGLSATCVTWGGDQREPDGGIDVRVQLHDKDSVPDSRWLHWKSVGFQVKATEMPPAKIKKEMCPNGSLQSAIQDLLQVGGAYIIAAHDSVADQRYKERVAAMRESAVGLLQGGNSGCVDYYDSRRLADWASEYPTVVAWVHNKTQGGALHGWEPYGQWATSKRIPDGKYPHFLPDEKARFIDPRDSERTFNLIQGIERVREVLRKGIERTGEEDGKPVRLVGLSGVGKTRFVQALFEADVGSDALDQELAVYADAGRTLNPPPAVVLDRLMSSKTRAVLIIDNCAPSLHRELVAELGKAGSKARVSLLTVEYDIREDLPEDTEVFRLEGGSDDLIERIIRTRFPNVTPVDADTIARFSNGNFRVAIALADSVGRKGSLAGLSDNELFKRLFWQRNDEDEGLLSAAEVCALVYSFDGENDSGELKSLASLADISVRQLRRLVSLLESRGLVQRRGIWRAILPHAIANRLAADALKYVSYGSIERQIVAQDPSVSDELRLLRSFSRRLGYLHGSEEAREIVGQWLSPDGLLGVAPESDRWSLYTELLNNVAPVDPKRALEVVERLVGNGSADVVIERYKSSIGAGFLEGYRKGGDPNIMLAAYKEDESLRKGRDRVITLIRSIAYYEDLFGRCLDVLLKFAVAEEKGRLIFDRQGPACEILESMFFVVLSGTLAKTGLRLKWLDDALRGSDEAVRSIACRCLSNALESQGFSSFYNFDFGARERDSGWRPSKEEKRDWYAKFIDLAVKVGVDSSHASEEVRGVLARKFGALWLAGMTDKLREAVHTLSATGWEEGWSAIRETIRLHGGEMEAENKRALQELERVIRPSNLLSRLRVLKLGDHFGEFLFEGEGSPDWWKDVDKRVQPMGRELAQEEHLMPEVARLLTGGGRHGNPTFKVALGKSIAVQASDMKKMWDVLLEGFASWPKMERDEAVLKGYLEGVFDRDLALFNRLLDEAAERQSLVGHVPSLQAFAPLDSQGRDRLLALMKHPDVCAMDFCRGWNGQFGMQLIDRRYPDDRVAAVLKGLLGMRDGALAAVKKLSLYVCQRECPVQRGLFEVAYDVLSSVLLTTEADSIFSSRSGCLVHSVVSVIKFFFGLKSGVNSEEREERARQIMRRLVDGGVSRWMVILSDFMVVLGAFFDVQPGAALDIFVGDDEGDEAKSRRSALGGSEFFSDGYNRSLSVSETTLLEWCESGGAGRWIRAANSVCAVVLAMEDTSDGARWQWSSQASALLNNAPNPCEVAEVLVEHIRPNCWGGNMSDNLEERLPLIDQLSEILGAEYADKIELWRKDLLAEIGDEKKREEKAEAARQKAQARFE